jgi:hypothetical protein
MLCKQLSRYIVEGIMTRKNARACPEQKQFFPTFSICSWLTQKYEIPRYGGRTVTGIHWYQWYFLTYILKSQTLMQVSWKHKNVFSPLFLLTSVPFSTWNRAWICSCRIISPAGNCVHTAWHSRLVYSSQYQMKSQGLSQLRSNRGTGT